MKKLIPVLLLLTACAGESTQKSTQKKSSTDAPKKAVTTVANTQPLNKDCKGPLNHQMNNVEGQPVSLCDYQNKVVLAVNTASFCGYTPQYEQLEALYQKYREQGLVVLGFPANEFGEQEPGSDAEIKAFCEDKYNVTFPLFAKSVVKGDQATPFYKGLIQATGQEPLWNFHKYLIDKEGHITSYKSAVRPMSPVLLKDIEKAL